MVKDGNSCHLPSHCNESCDETGGDSTVQDPPDRDAGNTGIVSARSLIAGGHGRNLEGVTPCSLSEALENTRGRLVSFTGQVVRVYRRKVAIGREYREEDRG